MCFVKCLKKAKSFLLEPTKAFKKEQKTSFVEAFKYVLVIGPILAILNGVIAGLILPIISPLAGIITIIAVAIMSYVALIITPFISGLIVHLFAYLLGAKKGLEQTLKVTFYSQTPSMLFGWIPIIGSIFGIYGIVLQIIGIKNLQKMTMGRAILAVLLPIIILSVLLIIGILLLIFTIFSLGIPFDANMFT
ncbi:MAG: YIP1 family protein [Nanoarchaeota archaeon]